MRATKLLDLSHKLPGFPGAPVAFQTISHVCQTVFRVKTWQISWTITCIDGGFQGSLLFPNGGFLNDNGIPTGQPQDERFIVLDRLQIQTGVDLSGIQAGIDVTISGGDEDIFFYTTTPYQPFDENIPFPWATTLTRLEGFFQFKDSIFVVSTIQLSGIQGNFNGIPFAIESSDPITNPGSGEIIITAQEYWPYALPDGSNPLYDSQTGAPLESI